MQTIVKVSMYTALHIQNSTRDRSGHCHMERALSKAEARLVMAVQLCMVAALRTS